jgi:uncharacterized protein YnzC (UPF0291/DUF896 family)
MGMMDDMQDNMGDMSSRDKDERLEYLSNKAKSGELTDTERDEMARLQANP